MDHAAWFAICSSLIVLAGAPFYLRDILRGHTRPERTTWLIWSVQAMIAFFSQLKLGARWSLLFFGLGAIGNLVVYGLSLRHGYGGWKRADKIALVVATLGVIIAWATHDAMAALWGVIIADFAGAVLTIQKAYKIPKSETTITWLLAGLAAVLTALSVGRFSFDLLIYPIYLASICFAIPIAQVLGRAAKTEHKRSVESATPPMDASE